LTSLVPNMAIAATSAASSTAYHEAIEIFGLSQVLARDGRWIITLTLTLPNEMDGPHGDIMANAETQVQVPATKFVYAHEPARGEAAL